MPVARRSRSSARPIAWRAVTRRRPRKINKGPRDIDPDNAELQELKGKLGSAPTKLRRRRLRPEEPVKEGPKKAKEKPKGRLGSLRGRES